MSGSDHYDDALDAAIDALQRGRPLEATLAGQGRYTAVLRPLLEAAEDVRGAPRAPLSRNLVHNYAIVQAAVERAQISARNVAELAPRPAIWSRRLRFASFSAPAGVLALVLTAGAAGAAASIAVTDVGSKVGDIIVPDAIVDLAPGKSGDAPGHTGESPSPAANGADGETPGDLNRPTDTSVTGTVTSTNGNTFTLTNDAGEWQVQIDANTEVTGEILEGGTASVTGDATAEKNLHATSVEASGGTPAEQGKPDDPGQPTDPGQPGALPAHEQGDGTPGSDSQGQDQEPQHDGQQDSD